MPKLPDPYERRSTPEPSGGVVQIDATGAARSKASNASRTAQIEAGLVRREGQVKLDAVDTVTRSKVAYLNAKEKQGVVMQEIGDYVFRQGMAMKERQDKRDYVSAKTEFLKQKTLLDSEFENDTDYETFTTRYTERINKVRNEVSKGIKNTRIRQAFAEELELDIAQGLVKVNSQALAREKDSGRAGLTAILEDNLETAYRAPDEFTREETIASSNKAIEYALDNNYISEQEADKIRKDYSANYAMVRAKTLQPEQLLELLESDLKGKKNFINYIPPDKRASLLEVTRQEVLKNQSIGIADEYMANGYDLDEGYAAAQKIKDPVLREAVESRFDKMRTVADKQKKEDQYTAFMGNYVDIMKGEKSVDDMSREELLKFEQPQINAMISVEANRIKGQQRVHSDLSVLYKLEALEKKKDYDGMMDILMSEDINLLTRKDTENYLKIASSREVPQELKSFFTAKDQLSFQIKQAGIGGDHEMALRKEFDEWYTLYQQMNKKEPSDAEITGYIDKAFIKVGGEGIFNMEDYPFEEAPGSLTEDMIRQQDPAGLDKMRRILKEDMKREPSSRELVDHYKEAMGYR